MTQRQEFTKALKAKGFTVSNFQGQPFQGRLDLVPHHRKTADGHHNIINSINFVIFGGSDTKEGDLGCVTMYYGGRERLKYRRNSQSGEILKKAFCPKTVKEAIQTFDIWNSKSNLVIDSWETIL
jgi:hypothetical protein